MQRAILRRSDRSISCCSASKRMTPGQPVKDFISSWDRRQLFSQSRTGLMPPSNSVGKWECNTSSAGWPMSPHKLSHQELLLKQREQEVSSLLSQNDLEDTSWESVCLPNG